MKSKNKAFQLIEKGLSTETVSKLSENEISVLHKKLLSEVTMVSAQDSTTIAKLQADRKPYEVYEKELEEDQDVTLGNVTKGEISQDPKQVQNWDGTDDDSNPSSPAHDQEGAVESEMKEGRKKKTKTNPWAICTAQLGNEFGTRERHLWSAKEKNKYERCVKDVKKSLKEGKNPVSLFLEQEIIKIVERNLPPKITKGELMKYIKEDGPAVAPTKPKEKPGTKEKPGKPTRPMRPGKNPHPGEKESPRAEDAKDTIIKTIMKLFKK